MFYNWCTAVSQTNPKSIPISTFFPRIKQNRRVSNRGATKWRPMVGELQFWTETDGEACGGHKMSGYTAARADAGFQNWLCSGADACDVEWGCTGTDDVFACYHAVNQGNMGRTVEGIQHYSWRAQCKYCRAHEAWIGVMFDEPRSVGCVHVYGGANKLGNSLGQGAGGGQTYSGGLAVEASNDGENWVGIRMTVPGSPNMASVIDGSSCDSWSCCEGDGCDQ